jgi:hypothetical protein
MGKLTLEILVCAAESFSGPLPAFFRSMVQLVPKSMADWLRVITSATYLHPCVTTLQWLPYQAGPPDALR